jgi:hypothetical protein
MYNNSLHAERLIRATKAIDPRIVTVAGGAHFGALSSAALDRIPDLDFAVRGEGEVAFAQLVEAIDGGAAPDAIPRICSRSPGGARDDSSGPLMDLARVAPIWTSLGDAIEVGRYIATVPAGSLRKSIYIEAGRGCPFACSFCATAPFWQRRYRVKRVDVIVDEIRHLHEVYGYDTFMLVHDLLTADRRFMDEFCAAMFAAALPVEWTANHRADIRLGDLPSKMRSAGCLSVFMGIETASERLQSEIDKGLTRSRILSTVGGLREVGIASTCSFIVGFPSETPAEISATLGLAAELKILGAEPVQVHRLRRWPPAPLAAREMPASFDIEALRLEYPSRAIPPEDVAAIQADPAFFMGYFTPSSLAGSPYQLAQLELFFANMLAIMPITTAVLGSVYGEKLAESYYRALDAAGPLARDNLDTAHNVRAALTPFVEAWVASDEGLAQWQRALLQGTLAYECARIGFITGADHGEAALVGVGADWAVFAVTVDVVRLLQRLAAGDVLSADLHENGHVALSRHAEGAVRGFALTPSFVSRIRGEDTEAIAALRAG